MRKVLITAYAVNPFKGSEDGTGWNITRELAKESKVILITRKNNILHLEKYSTQKDDPCMKNIQFYGFDLPEWVMRLKKKSGERGYVLYFYLWQLFVTLFIKRQKFVFDIAHSLNFHSDSHPNFLWMLGKPTYWGPIGHHPKVPSRFILEQYGTPEYLKDRLYFYVKWCMRNLDPFYRLAVRRSTHIFGINSSVQEVMGVETERFTILPAVASEKPSSVNRISEGFNVLSVGRFHYMKGFDIAIQSFSNFCSSLEKEERTNVKLTLVGKGEEQVRLQTLAKSLGIGNSIEWIEWVDKKEMSRIYRSSDVFLFPSHEGAGMVIPEALSYGLPTLCFDNVGPGELLGDAGMKVNQGTYFEAVTDFGKLLMELYLNDELRDTLKLSALSRFENEFKWATKAEKIRSLYPQVSQEGVNMTSSTIAVFHPSSELYGADRILVNALKALPLSTHKRIYLKFGGPLHELIRKEVENAEIILNPSMPIIYRKIFTPAGVIGFAKDWFKFFRFMRVEKRKHDFGSAYVNTLSTSFILPILKWLAIPNYIHVHEIIERPTLIAKITTLLSLWYSDRILCVSQAVLKGMTHHYTSVKKKAEIIYNGIDPIKVKSEKRKGPMKFFLFGRIMPQKGQWYLIEALSRIPRPFLKDARFILMGGVLKGREGLLEDLNEKIQELNLEHHVEIRDFAPDIAQAMNEADVCLVPSKMKDPFPTTVLEAMSAGKAVIATDHGGAKEAIVDGETGFLVGPDNPKFFAEKIMTLINNTKEVERLGNNAKKRYLNYFTIEHFNKNWRRLSVRFSKAA